MFDIWDAIIIVNLSVVGFEVDGKNWREIHRSGFDFDDILVLNCRSEILFAVPDGCSVIAAVPEMTANGHTLLAQTWDWTENSLDTIVALKIKQDPLPSMVIFTEAGIIGGKGINSKGLGVTLNATSTGKGRVGVPLHILYRGILNQKSFSEAVEVVTKAQRAGCGCFNVASSDGLAGSIEFTPEKFDVLMCEDRPLCHTNHYLSPLIRAEDLKFISTHAHTLVRLNVIRRRTQLAGKLDLPKIEAILKDHFEAVTRIDESRLNDVSRVVDSTRESSTSIPATPARLRRCALRWIFKRRRL